MIVSISDLSNLTGMDRRRVRKVCRDLKATKGPKGSIQYASGEALPLLYGVEDTEGEDSRLTRFRADKVELELGALRGDLLQKSEVVQEVQRMFVAVRSRLLSLPAKAAPEIAIINKPAKIQAHLQKLVREALRELSELRT